MDDLSSRRLRRTREPAVAVTASAPPGLAPAVASPGGPRSTCTLSLTPEGTVWAAAADAEDVLGWLPEDLVGRHVSCLLPRLALELDAGHLDLLLAEGEAGTLIDDATRRDGRSFKASVGFAAARGVGGQLTGLTAVVRDISAGLRAGGGSALRATGRGAGRPTRRAQAFLVTDAGLTLAYATVSAAQLLGSPPAELLARPGLDLFHEADQPVVGAAVDRVLADPVRDELFVARLRVKDQRWRWVEGTVSNLLADAAVRGLVVALSDVTERVRRQEARRVSRALHRARVESAEEGIVVAGADGSARYANAAASRLLGLSDEQMYGIDLLDLLGPPPLDDAVEGVDKDATVAALPAPHPDGEVSRHEMTYAHPDGTERVLEVARGRLSDPGAAEDGAGPAGWLVTVNDVTDLRRSERVLRHRALYDQLTGLPNRYLLRDRLEMAAARQRRSGGEGTAVLFVDLDRFKAVNDTHGHAVGDELLREVAARLTGSVRATDTVCRLGGDEFVIVCEDLDAAGVRSVVERLQEELRTPFEKAGRRVEVGASIGIALSPPHDLEELVELADVAMYDAKRRGGDASSFAGPHP